MLVSRVINGASTRMMAARAIARSPNLLSNSSPFTNQVFKTRQIHGLPTYFKSSDVSNVKNVVSSEPLTEGEGQGVKLQREILSSIAQLKRNQEKMGTMLSEKMGTMLSEISEIHQVRDARLRLQADEANKTKEIEETMKKILAEREATDTRNAKMEAEQRKMFAMLGEMEEKMKEIQADHWKIETLVTYGELWKMMESIVVVKMMEMDSKFPSRNLPAGGRAGWDDSIKGIQADQMKMETMIAGIHEGPQAQKTMEAMVKAKVKEMETAKEKKDEIRFTMYHFCFVILFVVETLGLSYVVFHYL